MEKLDYTDYDALHVTEKKFIASCKKVDEENVTVTSMIYHQCRRSIAIREPVMFFKPVV